MLISTCASGGTLRQKFQLTFYPSTKGPGRPKLKASRVFFRGASAHDVQPVVAPPKQAFALSDFDRQTGVVVSYHHTIIMLTQYYDFHLIVMMSDRKDLKIVVSGAKFDAESDFEVRLAVARQKPDQNNEKLIL